MLLPIQEARKDLTSPKFEIGVCAGTPAVLKYLRQMGVSPMTLIGRHAQCDFGDVCAEERRYHLRNLKYRGGARSIYRLPFDSGARQGDQQKVYVVTDPGHQTTVVCFPHEV